MRDIKFRVWDTENKIWVNLMSLFTNWHETEYAGVVTVFRDRVILNSGEWVIWEQYTGLKDKNGKEIFEGDIIIDAGFKYFIRFNSVFACFGLSKLKGATISIPKDIEVIGNIHENPELLEVTHDS